MTRISKQEERRHKSPRRPRFPAAKTGPLKDNLKDGYKPHENAGESGAFFIAKVKEVRNV